MGEKDGKFRILEGRIYFILEGKIDRVYGRVGVDNIRMKSMDSNVENKSMESRKMTTRNIAGRRTKSVYKD